MRHTWDRLEMLTKFLYEVNSKEKKTFGRPKQTLKYDIKKDIKDIEWEVVDWKWFHVCCGQIRCSNEPACSIKCGEFLNLLLPELFFF
jgi:hypothetical protein